MLTITRNILFFICFILSIPALSAEKPTPGLNEATLKGLAWRSIGPAIASGRIADLAVGFDQGDFLDPEVFQAAADHAGDFRRSQVPGPVGQRFGIVHSAGLDQHRS